VLNRPQSNSTFWEEERRRLRERYPSLFNYLDRIGAKVTLNFRSHVIREKDEGSRYYHDRVRIKVENSGEIEVEPGYLFKDEIDPADFKPSEEEQEKIKAEVAAKPFPRSIPGCLDDPILDLVGVDPSELFPCFEKKGKLVLMIHRRKVDKSDGESYYVPYSFWDDGVWRQMEPDGLLPLFGLERQFSEDCREYARAKIMIHEGAKAARRVYELLERGDHPWREELATYVHLGWIGGVNRVHDVDWSPIKKLDPNYHVTLACDYDVGGINAASAISKNLQRSLLALKFDDRFPETFDLADDWPTHKSWWHGAHYRGPRLDEFLFPATWATKALKVPGSDKPIFNITNRFAAEWLWVESQDAFVNRQQPNILRKRAAFNSRVRSFSDVEDTARLFDRLEAPKCDGLAYEPGAPPGVVNVGGERLVNLYRPTDVKPIEGNPTPFLRFLTHLVPDRIDRKFVLRWITTLVACPWVKMSIANLGVSERQGVGKTTLGEILARLVGLHNTSFPNEKEIVDSGFTSWIRNKRLVIINEIYPGRSKNSRKMYDVLKERVTDPHVDVNEKYLKPHTISNHAHFLAFSNSTQALHLDDDDRRWFVPEVTETLRNKEYWDGFYAWWKNGDGLGIIYGWLLKLVEDPAYVVSTGERAPSSAAKKEMIADLMSDGERIAFDHGEHVAELNTESETRPPEKLKKIVHAVDDVRDWVATRLQMSREDPRLPSPLAIRRALVRAGLREPKLAKGEKRKRFPIAALGGRKCFIVANFAIAAGAKWDDLREFYTNADGAARV
jgi:hypothetical protein